MLVFEYPLRLFAKRPIYIFSSTCENIQKILLNNNMSSPVGFEHVGGHRFEFCKKANIFL